MSFDVKVADGVATIRPPARFNFELHRQFREACKASLSDAAVKMLIVDFQGVEYIDSSVLGSLIFAKDSLCRNEQIIRLAHASGVVKEILEVAAFHRLFEMI